MSDRGELMERQVGPDSPGLKKAGAYAFGRYALDRVREVDKPDYMADCIGSPRPVRTSHQGKKVLTSELSHVRSPSRSRTFTASGAQLAP